MACVSARSGWRGYVLRALKRLKEKARVDGFWLDSHWNFGLEPINYAESPPVPQFDDFLRPQAELERSPFGLPAQGPEVRFSELGDYPKIARFCYKTSPMVCAKRRAHETLTKIGYFKLLAFKATPIIFFHDLLASGTPFKEEVVYANRAFLKVHDLMDRARLLPGGGGVE